MSSRRVARSRQASSPSRATPFDTLKKKSWRKRPSVTPPFKLDNLDDLLYVAWNYSEDAFDWFSLWRMIPALEELNRVVGMHALKQEVVDMIVSHLIGEGPSVCYHTVLMGGAGCGKTMVATILAKIYCLMGVTKTERIVIKKRSDFIGKWVGHTEERTMSILNEALGGVLLIDEAYSMGHGDKVDVFSKASVDLINQFLSEHASEFVCIIAGYEKSLQDDFFSINPGLERRFPWKFKLDTYTGAELQAVFHLKLREGGWSIAADAMPADFVEQNREYFPAYGGDIATFLTKCKLNHNRRMLGFREGVKTLTKEDVVQGFDKYKQHKRAGLYSPDYVLESFIRVVKNAKWKVESNVIDATFFKPHEVLFITEGDVEHFFYCCRVKHNKRLGGYREDDRVLTRPDIEHGLTMHKDRKRTQEETTAPMGMFT